MKMRFIFSILTTVLFILVIDNIIAVMHVSDDHQVRVKLLTSRIIRELGHNYQTMIFKPLQNPSTSARVNIFIQNIIREMPTSVLNTYTIGIELLVYKNLLRALWQSKESALFLAIIERVQEYEAMKDFFIFFENVQQMVVHDSKPKCLIIDFGISVSLKFEQYITRSAWKHKILDYSLITITKNDEGLVPIIKMFNPFNRMYTDKPLEDSAEIFPKKLVNTRYYPLKVALGIIPNVKGIRDPNVLLVILAARKLNFTINFQFINDVNEFSEKLATGEFNMIVQRVVYQPNVFWANGLQILDDSIKIVAVVPYARSLKVSMPLQAFTFLLVVLVILLIVAIVKTLFGEHGKYWDLFNVVLLLLGGTATTLPSSRIQSIFFACFGFISFIYSADFFSDVIDFKIATDSLDYDNFEQIDRSQLPIFIGRSNYPAVRDAHDFDLHLTSIKSKILVREALNCFNDMKNMTRIICLVIEIYARIVVASSTELRMRIAKPIFASLKYIYFVENNSPYLHEFQRLIDRLVETGISIYVKRTLSMKEKKLAPKVVEEENDLTLNVMFGILVVGYILSSVCFAWEMRRKYSISAYIYKALIDLIGRKKN